MISSATWQPDAAGHRQNSVIEWTSSVACWQPFSARIRRQNYCLSTGPTLTLTYNTFCQLSKASARLWRDTSPLGRIYQLSADAGVKCEQRLTPTPTVELLEQFASSTSSTWHSLSVVMPFIEYDRFFILWSPYFVVIVLFVFVSCCKFKSGIYKCGNFNHTQKSCSTKNYGHDLQCCCLTCVVYRVESGYSHLRKCEYHQLIG